MPHPTRAAQLLLRSTITPAPRAPRQSLLPSPERATVTRNASRALRARRSDPSSPRPSNSKSPRALRCLALHAIALAALFPLSGCVTTTTARPANSASALILEQEFGAPRPAPVQPPQPSATAPPAAPPSAPIPGAPGPSAAPAARTPDPNAVATAFDPCGDRLHEIAGLLLQYYARHLRLPARLADLTPAPGAPLASVAADPDQYFRCPASGRPYVYTLQGPPIATGVTGSHLILYDAAPAHDGSRWGIAIAEPQGKQPLTARVVVIPNGLFPAP